MQELVARFNGSAPAAWEERDVLLRRMLRHVGQDVVVRPPFYCEYGAIASATGRSSASTRSCWTVGAGAVVTRDLPAGVVAVGVPARVLREIGEQDHVEACRCGSRSAAA
jgi:acetyltransferase-like isoleucine patch superfamily enzyme